MLNARVQRWYTIFTLLSMERIEPLLPEMGLDLSDVDAVRTVARRFIELYEQWWEGKLEGDLFLKDTFDQITKATDDKTSQHLQHWGTHLFPWRADEDATEFVWTLLLPGLANFEDWPHALERPALPINKVNSIVQSVREQFGDYDSLKHRIEEEVEKLPKSEWEERIYTQYESTGSPLDWAISVIGFHRFRKTWLHIESVLSAEELEILLEWARAEAKHMKIPLELVGMPSTSLNPPS